MKSRNLFILILITAALVAAAIITSRKNPSSARETTGDTIYPNLPVNDIEKIIITASRHTSTLTKKNDVWVVSERSDYPANFIAIKDFVIKLSQLKIDHTARLTNKQKIELNIIAPKSSDPESEEQAGTLIKLLGKNDIHIASLLVGNVLEQEWNEPGGMRGIYPAGHYVSPDNGANVYFTASLFEETSFKPRGWTKKDLVNVAPHEIKRISIVGAEEKEAIFSRESDRGLLLPSGRPPDGYQVDPSKIKKLESSLSDLKLYDVANPALSDEATGFNKPITFKATTENNELYTVTLGKITNRKNARYARIKVDRSKDTKALNEKMGKWIYLLDINKIKPMTSKRIDFTKKN